MKTPIFASMLALTAIAACTTPGIDYQTQLMPASLEAAATRTVQVDRFHGPAGGWYAERFEDMLANTVFDGQPWFQLADLSYVDVSDMLAGTYTGDIQIDSYTTDEYTRIVSKCVEWDGLFDCETRIDVEELCITDRVNVSVHPRLIDARSGQVVFSGSYGGDASSEACGESHHGGGWHAGHGGGLFGTASYAPPPDLVYEALSETLQPIRHDIAPRNATVRAVFIEEAVHPVVRADPRFQQAVKIASRDPFAACETWVSLAEVYPDAPAVIHNMGACAEASNDFTVAQGLYARSAELSAAYSKDGVSPLSAYAKALRRLSEQRNGLLMIDQLSRTNDAEDTPEAGS